MSSSSEPQDLITNDVNKMNVETQELIDKAADLVLHCRAILFTSGAGMGVNSGFGTFRGITADVWPPLLHHPELGYTSMCNPSWFRKPLVEHSKIDVHWRIRSKGQAIELPMEALTALTLIDEAYHVTLLRDQKKA
ncbi:unnamed protein product [Rotaria sordida]|uniref:Deacetylase sirtuin-type domain-containing protein n=1 Tax=Rotaria sordida TaxID=392033 RepID=A0A814QWN9_9BILA|nr:unnamed protein product [Rotaria sordida]CAF1426218.1 unnamed protein product [Rotaria sordida]CAF1495323.1 unnamed protein product [Rotaria sordida]CAF3734069.1 unnamed protein product [Rotaria sordida]CAF4079526.1 unnamed protein product [Rotaria sordida]